MKIRISLLTKATQIYRDYVSLMKDVRSGEATVKPQIVGAGVGMTWSHLCHGMSDINKGCRNLEASMRTTRLHSSIQPNAWALGLQ